jgi:hypothetical protein
MFIFISWSSISYKSGKAVSQDCNAIALLY